MAKGGPKTSVGKAIVAGNAIRHGVLSPVPVLAGLEDPVLWECHRTGVMESLAPVGHLETVLAERAALLLWRLGRAARYEGEAIALRQEDVIENTRETVVLGHYKPACEDLTLPELREREANRRAKARMLKSFPSWPDDRGMEPSRASEVIYAVEEAAFGDADPPEELSYPGVPDDLAVEDVEGWTAGKVRLCLQAISACCGDPVEELQAAAVETLEYEAARLKEAAKRLEREIERKRRQWILPDETTLGKVCRYEAHLHRQFISTLHELEALQARRNGQAAPLARLDVSGLPGE